MDIITLKHERYGFEKSVSFIFTDRKLKILYSLTQAEGYGSTYEFINRNQISDTVKYVLSEQRDSFGSKIKILYNSTYQDILNLVHFKKPNTQDYSWELGDYVSDLEALNNITTGVCKYVQDFSTAPNIDPHEVIDVLHSIANSDVDYSKNCSDVLTDFEKTLGHLQARGYM